MGGAFSAQHAAAAGDSGGPDAVIAVHTTDEWNQQWNSHQQSNKLIVLDFSASWCGPCRFMEPVFRAMSNQFHDVVFVKIDVDELPDVSKQWKVQAMPTFVLVKGGKEISRVVGSKKDELERKIAQFKN